MFSVAALFYIFYFAIVCFEVPNGKRVRTTGGQTMEFYLYPEFSPVVGKLVAMLLSVVGVR